MPYLTFLEWGLGILGIAWVPASQDDHSLSNVPSILYVYVQMLPMLFSLELTDHSDSTWGQHNWVLWERLPINRYGQWFGAHGREKRACWNQVLFKLLNIIIPPVGQVNPERYHHLGEVDGLGPMSWDADAEYSECPSIHKGTIPKRRGNFPVKQWSLCIWRL